MDNYWVRLEQIDGDGVREVTIETTSMQKATEAAEAANPGWRATAGEKL